VDNPSTRIPQRNLLNTEKVMFTTDHEGKINGRELLDGAYTIKVKAKGTGIIPMNYPEDSNRLIVYNIVLETLLYGAPYDVATLGVVVTFVLVLLVVLLIPKIFSWVTGFTKLTPKVLQ